MKAQYAILNARVILSLTNESHYFIVFCCQMLMPHIRTISYSGDDDAELVIYLLVLFATHAQKLCRKQPSIGLILAAAFRRKTLQRIARANAGLIVILLPDSSIGAVK